MKCPICNKGMVIFSTSDKTTVYICSNPECKHQVVEEKN